MKSYYKTYSLKALLTLLITFSPGVFAHTGDRESSSRSKEQILQQLVEGNKRYVAKANETPARVGLKNAARSRGQYPTTIVVAPTSSKISPEVLFDQGLGNLFVIRTSSEQLDAKAAQRIQFAIAELNSTVILILGMDSPDAEGMGFSSMSSFETRMDQKIQQLPIVRRLHQEGKVTIVGSRLNAQTGVVHFLDGREKIRMSQN